MSTKLRQQVKTPTPKSNPTQPTASTVETASQTIQNILNEPEPAKIVQPLTVQPTAEVKPTEPVLQGTNVVTQPAQEVGDNIDDHDDEPEDHEDADDQDDGDDQDEVDEKKPKKKSNSAIAPARVRKFMDPEGVNKVIEGPSNEIKEKLEVFKRAENILGTGEISVPAGDGKAKSGTVKRPITEAERLEFQEVIAKHGPYVEEYRSDLAAFSGARVRFSNDASDVLAVICSSIVYQAIEASIEVIKTLDRKSIQTSHFYRSNFKNMKTYPLIVGLPSFQAQLDETRRREAEIVTQKKIKDAVSQAEKDLKKALGVTGKRKIEKTNKKVVEDKKEKEEEDDGVSPFKTYMRKICVTANEQLGSDANLSTDFKNHMSTLLLEFIRRTTNEARLLVEFMNNKTINRGALLKVIEMNLSSNCQLVESCSIAMVNDPTEEKEEYTKVNEAKKRGGPAYVPDFSQIKKVKKVVRTTLYEGSHFPELKKNVTEAVVVEPVAPKK